MYKMIHRQLNDDVDPYRTGGNFWDDVGPYRDADFEDLWATPIGGLRARIGDLHKDDMNTDI